MTALVRHHTRWCLLFTVACLVVAFTLHDAAAQRFRRPGGGFAGRPGGVIGNPGGFAGRPGGFSGMPGGVVGNPGGFVGRPGGVIGNPGGIGGMPGGNFTGMNPGLGGGLRFVYTCSNCRREVGATASSCPFCGTRFINRPGGLTSPLNPGMNPGFNPGFNPGQPNFNPGQPNPQPPFQPASTPPPANAWKPATPPAPEPTKPATEPTASTPSDSSSNSSDDAKSGGWSSKVIIGAGVAALGVFALIAGVVVAMSSGGSASQKLKRRPKSFD